MLRLDYPEIEAKQISMAESLIPHEVLRLPPDLEKADKILKDERFEEPFIEKFNVTIGRGTIPIRPYIRLMVLKYSNNWSYDILEKKVNDSFSLKKFCRIPIERLAPDHSTMARLNQKYNDDVMKELNKSLVKQLVERKFIRGKKINVGPAAIETHIYYHSYANFLRKYMDMITKKSGR